MRSVKKLLALLLAVAMLATLFVGCKTEPTNETEKKPGNEPSKEQTSSGTLVVANSPMPGVFSPFFFTTIYDSTVNAFTTLGTLGVDRAGDPILKGLEGEKRVYSVSGVEYQYNSLSNYEVTVNKDGSVDYDITMRDDIKFSDGSTANIDDLIFAVYVYADPSYDGTNSFFMLPIEGMQDYHGSMKTRYDIIAAAGPEGFKENKFFTKEQYDYFWNYYNNEAVDLYMKEICEYLVAEGICQAGDSIATMAKVWDGYELGEDATYKDFWEAIIANPVYTTVEEAEAKNWRETRLELMREFFGEEYFEYLVTDEGTDYISGVIRTGDYSMRIHCTEYAATTLKGLSLPICSRKFYGDPDYGYDYANHKFGFPRGDLTKVKEKNGTPTVVSGPYFFKSYKDNVLTLEANPYFIDGMPKIKTLKFQAANEDEFVSNLIIGAVDVCDPPLITENVSAIKHHNSNGELTGDKVTTVLMDHNGFGYIGANSNMVCVKNDPNSEASKNLRKAIMTAMAVGRPAAIDTFYGGEMASVSEYPISRLSAVAPVVTDDDYKIAYSTALDGTPIYKDSMSMEEKKRAAAKACLEYLEAAGYKVENGKVTEAPEGAKGTTEDTAYEIVIVGFGKQNHVAIPSATDGKEILESIGFHLTILDVDPNVWQGAVYSYNAELFAASWTFDDVDSDMASLFHSGEANNLTKTEDSKLDKLLTDARASDNVTYRKAAYKQVFDIIFDWGTVLPIYQKKVGTFISNERINIDTLPKDMSPYYPWYAEIANLELRDQK